MLEIQPFINFVVNYWAYLVIGSLGAGTILLRRNLVNAERRAAAEREQTLFLSILYIIMRSGKTVMDALTEATRRKEIIKTLSAEASYLKRIGERKTLGESFSQYVHPSREFSLLINSLGEDLQSGFGVVEKLEKLLEKSTERESERWSRYVNTVETLGESIVSVILLVPLMYIVGSIFGGFPILYVVVIVLGAAAAFYIVAAASEPLHLVDVPRTILLSSIVSIVVSGIILMMLFFNAEFVYASVAVGFFLVGWGSFTHFRYIRRAVQEGEAAFLLLDSVAARLRAGYPVGRSLEAINDPRYARYAKSVARGLEIRPLNRFMRLSIETVKLARLGGLGAEAISLLSRLAITIYLSFVNARARMKLYDVLAIASGAVIIAVSAFAIAPFSDLPPQLSSEIERLIITPSLEPVLPSALLVSLSLGVAVAKTGDQTVVGLWRSGAGVLTTLAAYWMASLLL